MSRPAGYKHSKIIKRKMSKSHFGLKHSNKTKRKISLTKCGKYCGRKNGNWKGGKIINRDYIYVYSPNHPNNYKNYIAEHHLIVEKHLGRYLKKNEVVHHIDGNPNNNKINNLICFISQSIHARFHKNRQMIKQKDIIFNGGKI